jgi:hypothetical protein
MTTALTVHGVLAGCYRGKRANLKVLLTHYGVPGDTENALCGRVSDHGLCDLELEGPPTCPVCVRKAAKL